MLLENKFLNHKREAVAALGFSNHGPQQYLPVEESQRMLHWDPDVEDSLPGSHPGTHPGAGQQRYRHNNQGEAHTKRNAMSNEKPSGPAQLLCACGKLPRKRIA